MSVNTNIYLILYIQRVVGDFCLKHILCWATVTTYDNTKSACVWHFFHCSSYSYVSGSGINITRISLQFAKLETRNSLDTSFVKVVWIIKIPVDTKTNS